MVSTEQFREYLKKKEESGVRRVAVWDACVELQLPLVEVHRLFEEACARGEASPARASGWSDS